MVWILNRQTPTKGYYIWTGHLRLPPTMFLVKLLKKYLQILSLENGVVRRDGDSWEETVAEKMEAAEGGKAAPRTTPGTGSSAKGVGRRHRTAKIPAALEMYPPPASRSPCSTCHLREKHDPGNLIWEVIHLKCWVSNRAPAALAHHC